MDNEPLKIRVVWRDPAAFSVVGTDDPATALEHVPEDVIAFSSHHVADHYGEPCVLFLNVERMEQESLGTVASISVEAGVSRSDGTPFCRISVMLDDGRIANAHMPPTDVRQMALDWLGGAEAADSDALMVQELMESGVSRPGALDFLVGLRERRAAAGGSDL